MMKIRVSCRIRRLHFKCACRANQGTMYLRLFNGYQIFSVNHLNLTLHIGDLCFVGFVRRHYNHDSIEMRSQAQARHYWSRVAGQSMIE